MGKIVAALNLPLEVVQKYYDYIPETGEFITMEQVSYLYPAGAPRRPVWAKSNGQGRQCLALTIAGSPRRAAHIAYLLKTGEYVPQGKGIFYRDGNQENLHWDNLVLLDYSCGGKIPEGK